MRKLRASAMAGGEEQEALDVRLAVDTLLSQPFEQALESCAALREYIAARGEAAAELAEEFREHWHRDAPAELRQVLEELIDPAVAAASRVATEAFLRDPTSALPPFDFDGLDGSEGRGAEGEPERRTSEMELLSGEELEAKLLRADERAANKASEAAEVAENAKAEAAADAAAEALSRRAEALLALPFDEAMGECDALRKYVREREDSADVEIEFRTHWHLEAPSQLREVLVEVLDPEVAAEAAAAASAFNRRMAGIVDDGGLRARL